MLREWIKAVTPPIVVDGVRAILPAPPPPTPQLFDGHDLLFRRAAANIRRYGEYGCGLSTRWVLANTEAEVFSVDTSSDWINSVNSIFTVEERARLRIDHVNLGELKNWGRPVDYSCRGSIDKYTDSLWSGDNSLDLVLVDGRFRVCCFLTTLKFARAGTKIIFDDYTDRPHYHVVEEFIDREEVEGRQCLFVTPGVDELDQEKLDYEIDAFRLVMD